MRDLLLIFEALLLATAAVCFAFEEYAGAAAVVSLAIYAHLCRREREGR
jgi:hypothetical protein